MKTTDNQVKTLKMVFDENETLSSHRIFNCPRNTLTNTENDDNDAPELGFKKFLKYILKYGTI